MIIEKSKITPSKYQRAIYDEILNTNRNIVVRATAGCLHPDTPILMYNGTIKLASTIQVNDLLMGPDSQPRCVLKINQGQDIMYKIVPQKGMSWICNSKHILTVHNEYIANSIKKYKNTHHKSPLQDIDLSKLLKVSKVTISKNIKTDFLSQYRLQRTGVEFYNFNTPIPPYLMGLWLGDGTVNQSNITTKDQVIIDYCKSLKLSKITCKVIPDKNCFTIRFSGKGGIRSNTFRNEVLQAYSNKQKFIPKKYLINSTENRLQLLAGLIDSDGYLGTNVYEICSKFESLKDDILFLCRSLGLAAYATYSKRTIKSLKFEGWYWIINISGELSNIPCLLERKKAKPRKQIKSVLRTGFKIEEIGIGDWCGFQVDRDNRFLLGDFTITHNSGKTTTIVESTKLIPHGKEAIFTAFNKSIAEELSKRLPSHILYSTIHSIGMRALLTHYRTKLMVNEYKSFNFLKEVSSNDTLPEELKKSPEEFAEYQYRMRSAVDLVRMTLTDIQPGPIMDICNHYGVDILEYEVEDVINVIKKYDLYNRGLCRRFNAIDYVDMIYVPILNPKIKLPQFDFVFIDEAQDLNRCQQEFIERLKKPNGRAIVVGDPRQCQPIGTKVLLAGNIEKNIEDLQVGDYVIGYESKWGRGYVGSKLRKQTNLNETNQSPKILQIEKRFYNGKLICVKSLDKISKYTPEHICYAKFSCNPLYKTAQALYLMEKDGYYRIGITPFHSQMKQNPSLTYRARGERADKMWILKVYEDRREAFVDEQYYSYQFGIPQLRFQDNLTGLFNQKSLDELWSRFSKNELRQKAINILTHFDRLIQYPLWEKGKVNYFSKMHFRPIHACNLIPQFMELNHYDINNKSETVHNRSKIKAKIADFELYYEDYNDYVYSLEVSKYQNYVADGILTHNCIYSFMGADPNSFDNFVRKPNTIELPLSTCYRCGTEIVKLAKSVYPEIEPFENNHPGEIRYGELDEADEGDFILARNNRPLVYVYFELLEKGKNPIIVGKDIQEGLEALVNKVIKKSVDEGMAILQERLEQLKAELKEKGIKNIKANPRYEALNDKILTISIISNRFETMKEVKEQIAKMFDNKENCIVLTTIHKSKGLEANRVFIIERFDGMRLLPSPYAITEWQRVQEQNLKFVAITRTKKSLIFIPNIDSQ